MRIDEGIVQAEAQILDRVADLPIDLLAMAVASNIWRASQTFRLQLERNILRDYALSWASFSTLFIIWVWGPVGMSAIAEHQAVSRPTVTSTVGQLEKRGFCRREFAAPNGDRRTVHVSLTAEGQALIKQVFPHFNRGEADFVSPLTQSEQQTLAALLRKLVRAHHA